MSAAAPAPRRVLLVLLLVATTLWAVSNLIALQQQFKYFEQNLGLGFDNYRVYQAIWIISSIIAVLTVAPAIIALTRPRAAYWVAAAAALSTVIDVAATIASNFQYNGGNTPRALKNAYVEGLKGDFGWRLVNGALSFWLVVPVLVVWVVWAMRRPAAAPVSVGQAPAPQTHPAGAAAPVVDAWWVEVNGSNHGPYTWAQLTTYAADGRIAAGAPVRRADGPFVPLSTLIHP